MKTTSLYSRASLLQYLETHVPQLSCDYCIEIEVGTHGMNEAFLVTDFKVPAAGVSFTSHSVMGHLQPGVSYGDIPISYIRSSGDVEDTIETLFKKQYIDGVPKFIRTGDLPVVSIYRLCNPISGNIIGQASLSDVSLADKVKVATYYGCRFTFPMPNINLSSDAVAVYSTTISFESFELY